MQQNSIAPPATQLFKTVRPVGDATDRLSVDGGGVRPDRHGLGDGWIAVGPIAAAPRAQARTTTAKPNGESLSCSIFVEAMRAGDFLGSHQILPEQQKAWKQEHRCANDCLQVGVRCFESNIERRECYEKYSRCEYLANRVSHYGPPNLLERGSATGWAKQRQMLSR
jgi:hypothetical protein